MNTLVLRIPEAHRTTRDQKSADRKKVAARPIRGGRDAGRAAMEGPGPRGKITAGEVLQSSSSE
ncbi:MAG: hypothetical protein ACRDRA_12575 [Pseudonocardiaceae bacterium]